jgi:hypothetical protein
VVALSLVAGALAAARIRLSERVAATLTVFGGGVLFAAVALELVPEADAQAGVALTAAGLVAGTALYVGADAWVDRNEERSETRRMMHAAAVGHRMEMPADPHAFKEVSRRVATATVAGFAAGYLLS